MQPVKAETTKTKKPAGPPAAAKKVAAKGKPRQVKKPMWQAFEARDAEAEAKMLAAYRLARSSEESRINLALAEAKVAECLALDPGAEIATLKHPSLYPVKSQHAGSWAFATYSIKLNGRCIYNQRREMPSRNGAQDALAAGAFEMILERASTDTACRPTAAFVSRLHPESPMSPATARNIVEREGEAMEFACQKAVDEVGPVSPLPDEQRSLLAAPPELVAAALALVVPAQFQEEASRNPVAVAAPGVTLDAHIDAVIIKRQISTRAKKGASAGEAKLNKKQRGELKEKAGERKTVSVCCASIVRQGRQRLTLIGLDYTSLLLRVVAALVVNAARGLNVTVFADGEKAIHEGAVEILQTQVRGLQIILDWYHLRKKCGELLSLALNCRTKRKIHWAKVQEMLWHGCVDSAIAYLGAIPSDQIKNPKALETLATYWQARRTQIPVYSVRKQLGLKTSSNCAEKTCDLLVSRRQKRQGMAWSQDGSYAFASIRACIRNRRLKSWLASCDWSLAFIEDAA